MPKLGQLLVQRGWASPQDVQRALGVQRSSGGRLGTCLLETNALTEDLLVKALSEQHRLPAAGPEDLRGIPDETIAALPARVAVRCHAVPFRAFGTQVHVAMLDPRDLNHQDELAFALGKRVQPYAAAEVRIRQALDRYYGEEASSRFATLAERLDRARYLWSREEGREAVAGGAVAGGAVAGGAAGGAAGRVGARPGSPWEHPEAALFGDEQTRPGAVPAAAPAAPRQAAQTAVQRPAAPAAVPAAASGAPGSRPGRAAAPALSVALTEDERAELADGRARTPAAQEDGEDTRPVPADAPPLPLSFAQVEERLLRVTEPDEVARLLVGFLSRSFERVALFRILRDRVEGWRGTGSRLDEKCLQGFRAGFDQPSAFLNLRQGGSFYLGPLPAMAVHKTLARCWGGSLPRECLLLPVRLRGRLVTVILLDREPGPLGALDLEALIALTVAAGEAYERCILRRKKD